MSDRLKIDVNKIYRTIKLFEDDGMITIKPNGRRYSIISLKTCDIYEGDSLPFENKRETNDKQNSELSCGSSGVSLIENEKQIRNKRETIYKNSKKEKKEEKDICPSIYKEIISYLNQNTDTAYHHTSKANRQHISARLNEGYTLDDFKRVIDNKVAEWGGEPAKGEKDMRNYLRPETLFGSKFESYLNSKVVRKHKEKRDNFVQREYSDEFFKMLDNGSIGKVREK